MRTPSMSISLRGDKTYRNAINAVADQHNIPIADLVRDAIDSKYGDELRKFIDFFAASDGSQKNEFDNSETVEPAHAG